MQEISLSCRQHIFLFSFFYWISSRFFSCVTRLRIRLIADASMHIVICDTSFSIIYWNLLKYNVIPISSRDIVN